MFKQWFGAASFELGSIALLFSSTTSAAVLAAYFGMHAIGSALLALALLPLVPERYARPRICCSCSCFPLISSCRSPAWCA